MNVMVDKEKIEKIKKEKEIQQLKDTLSTVEEQNALLAYELMMVNTSKKSRSMKFGLVWFNSIKIYYEKELWSKDMVRDAVIQGKINDGEYESITSEKYSI